MNTDYLCIGHCCHDKTDKGYILGGTVSYAAVLAKAWAMQPSILTSVGSDFQFFDKFKKEGIPLHNKQSALTTTFDNRYTNEKRTQYLLARAETIIVDDLLEELHQTSIVHFGLIANEIHPAVLSAFPQSLTGLSIQGLLRQWDKDGLVSPKAMDWSILNAVDIVFLSDEDINGVEHYLEKVINNCSQVVLTHGARGATVYKDGQALFFPSFQVKEEDPTGAGDAFTTAYLIDYYKNSDIQSACAFAHCAASFVVEAEGLSKIPTVVEVSERRRAYYD